ncbi:MAG: Smr/MutS family protein [Alphaproteobacteria bacterium]|nr:Smr/MutS family protein [Alphaproteobacteria bacterium]
MMADYPPMEGDDDENTAWERIKKRVSPLRDKDRYYQPDSASTHFVNDLKAKPWVPSKPLWLSFLHPDEPLASQIEVRPVSPQQAGRAGVVSVDLHGLTLDAAWGLLENRIPQLRNQGIKRMIIITGKGSSPENVDRRLCDHVPKWLKHSSLSMYIKHVSQAEKHHGGAGALYVDFK